MLAILAMLGMDMLLLLQSLLSTAPADPATELVRTRLFLTTTAPALDLTVEGASLANAVFTLRSGPESVREVIDHNTIHIIRNPGRAPLDLQIDTILAGVLPRTTIGWRLASESAVPTRLEIWNVTRRGASRVDEFATDAAQAAFTSRGDLLRSAETIVRVPDVPSRLVLAFFYPWWDRTGWSNPALFIDAPVRPYESSDPVDLARVMSEARAAGLDALVVSWAGKDFNDQIDHRRMVACLTAAQSAGTKVAALFEATVANPQHEDGLADPETVFRWLTDIVDLYAPNAAYLAVDGRPVVMVYAAQRLSQAGWKEALNRLRATGREVLLIGEGINATRLGALDGLFYYASNEYQGDQILDFDRTQSLSVRTYHLLPGDTGKRRIWVATVSPGYDDRQLKDGRIPRTSDRDSGRYYDRQWQSAIDMRADWVVVTSWNEWMENTQIEPSVRYGDLYVTRTKMWGDRFRRRIPNR
jgi:Glycosyl hydrolase family 99